MTATIVRDTEARQTTSVRDTVEDLTSTAREEVFRHLRETKQVPGERRYKIMVLMKLVEVTHQHIQRLEALDE